MKFGHVTQDHLGEINFQLPLDHPQTGLVFGKSAKKTPKVYVGCAKWGRKEWVGLLYPDGTKDKDYLDHYVNHFNSIEMNTTFYSIKKANVSSWASKAPEGFKFSPKFNRSISHIKRLNEDSKRYTDYFLEACSGFEENLGASFLQIPDNFSGKYLDRLANYLEHIPKDFSLFVEFRHEDWTGDNTIFDETFSMLEEKGIGAALTDVAGRRDILHMRLTVPKAFIRFNGYGLHESDYKRLDDWVDRCKSWIENGLEELYFYGHQEDETHTPKTCDYFLEKLNKACGLNLSRPQFIN